MAETAELPPQDPSALADATVHATGQTYIDRYPESQPEPEPAGVVDGPAAQVKRIRAALGAGGRGAQ